MDLEQHIRNLKEYCETDKRFFDDYMESDFTKFCGGHIADIEAVLNALDSKDRVINEMAKDIKFLAKRTNPDLKPKELIESYYKYLQYLDTLKGGTDAKET